MLTLSVKQTKRLGELVSSCFCLRKPQQPKPSGPETGRAPPNQGHLRVREYFQVLRELSALTAFRGQGSEY